MRSKYLDIQIQHPRITPASLPRHADRIERRLAGAVTIEIVAEDEDQAVAPPTTSSPPLRDAVGHHRHAPIELHSVATDLWDRLKSSTRFIHYGDNGLLF